MKLFKTLTFVTSLLMLVSCSSGESSPKEDKKLLKSISLSGDYQTTFEVGDAFNYDGLIVTAFYSDNTSKEVNNYTVNAPKNMDVAGDKSVGVVYKEGGITQYANYTITVNEPYIPVSLISISLSGNYQTAFKVGDAFTYIGLVVTAYYSNGTSKTVTGYTVSTPDMSTSGVKTINVIYTESGISRGASYSITVNEIHPQVVTLVGISLSGSYQTTFLVEDIFTYEGLVVTATYSDSSSKTVTGYTVDSPNMSTTGTKTVTVKYSEGSVGCAVTYQITVIDRPEKQLENVIYEPLLGRQYYLNHIGDIYSTWKKYQGEGVVIAVIDIGFDTTHEEFKFLDGTSKITSNSASFKYQNGGVVTNVGISYAHDTSDSHGTFCAGVAAAGLNHKGVIGIAPMAKLMLLKTDAMPKSIAVAFKYAADNGAKVISISLGSYATGGGDLKPDGSDIKKVFDEPVEYCRNKGVVVVSAGGNGGEGGASMISVPTYPGATPGVIGVGGLKANSNSTIWEGSSINSSTDKFIDVVAPANGMFNICNYYKDGQHILYDGGNEGNKHKWNGTSFAAPIVAGMAALYFEKYPSASVDAFETALYNSTNAIETPSASNYGSVDIGKLLRTTGIDKVTITVQDNTETSLNLFIWDSRTGKAPSPWPGDTYTLIGGKFSTRINTSLYDSMIVSSLSGAQTIDLSIYPFIYGCVYDLTNAIGEIFDYTKTLYIGNYVGEQS